MLHQFRKYRRASGDCKDTRLNLPVVVLVPASAHCSGLSLFTVVLIFNRLWLCFDHHSFNLAKCEKKLITIIITILINILITTALSKKGTQYTTIFTSFGCVSALLLFCLSYPQPLIKH